METMILKAGKSYFRRDEEIESIVRVDEALGLAYNARGYSWDITGWRFGTHEDPSDLIREVPSADQAFIETSDIGLSVVRENRNLPFDEDAGCYPPMEDSVVRVNGGNYKAGKSTITITTDYATGEPLVSMSAYQALEKQLAEAKDQLDLASMTIHLMEGNHARELAYVIESREFQLQLNAHLNEREKQTFDQLVKTRKDRTKVVKKYQSVLERLHIVAMQRDNLISELTNIANASPRSWEMIRADFVEEFQPWAQSRARHALNQIESKTEKGESDDR